MRATNHSSSFLKIGQAASRLGCSIGSLRNWIQDGAIESIRTPGGHRLIPESAVREFLGYDEQAPGGSGNGGGVPVALVARVSTTKQGRGHSKGEESDLSRQEEVLRGYAKEHYPDSEPVMYSRIGSGLHYEHPVFLRLVNDLLDGKFSGGVVIATFSDRIARFGFSLIEQLAKRGGATIIILNGGEGDDISDISSDVIAIITHYSAKAHGLRSAKACTKHVTEDCLREMVELRKQNMGIKAIVRELNGRGHRMGVTENPENWTEELTGFVVMRFLDSNGVEKGLSRAMGFTDKEVDLVDEFLQERVIRTENSEDKITNNEMREAYSKFCERRGVVMEEKSRFGSLLVKKGLERRRTNTSRFWVKVRLS